ncbi:hypothetical protein QFC21_000340 [Naganishia friedmannii]|uniref:Uncharacterized protein n=1 Tax=Naganishia friedmannii TaxID=89922 RepID=A0ACC2WB68_9TREE|nr:hypothetical protein QFC21_000340 [Naganishia friedmannii]
MTCTLTAASPTLQDARNGPHKETYLLGYPLRRTYAPFLHNTLTRVADVPRTYHKVEDKDGVARFLELVHQDDFGGAAVTMPFKVAVMKHLDDLTPEGRAIGACNTVYWQTSSDGSRKLIGHNTDCVGIKRALDSITTVDYRRSSQGRPALVIGGGGTVRAAIYALHTWFGTSTIYIVNRDESEVAAVVQGFTESPIPGFEPTIVHVKTAVQAQELEAVAYVVGAVPCFPPITEAEIAARETVLAFMNKPEPGVMLEMCYAPKPWTDLAKIFKSNGWKVVTGDQAMIWQGIEQQKIWLNCSEDELPVQEVVAYVTQQVIQDSATGSEPPLQ